MENNETIVDDKAINQDANAQPVAETTLLAGKYTSVAELEKAYINSQAAYTKVSQELSSHKNAPVPNIGEVQKTAIKELANGDLSADTAKLVKEYALDTDILKAAAVSIVNERQALVNDFGGIEAVRELISWGETELSSAFTKMASAYDLNKASDVREVLTLIKDIRTVRTKGRAPAPSGNVQGVSRGEVSAEIPTFNTIEEYGKFIDANHKRMGHDIGFAQKVRMANKHLIRKH